jgi:hypothetical protein
MKLLSILSVLSMSAMASAFSVSGNNALRVSPKSSAVNVPSGHNQISNIASSMQLFSTNDDEMNESSTPAPPAPVVAQEPENDYPLDVPSPILLASSMVLAIATTGSIFELSGGHPVLGMIPSVGIIVTGLPLCFFLFYAAIKKGIAETDEDDKRFQQKSNRF